MLQWGQWDPLQKQANCPGLIHSPHILAKRPPHIPAPERIPPALLDAYSYQVWFSTCCLLFTCDAVSLLALMPDTDVGTPSDRILFQYYSNKSRPASRTFAIRAPSLSTTSPKDIRHVRAVFSSSRTLARATTATSPSGTRRGPTLTTCNANAHRCINITHAHARARTHTHTHAHNANTCTRIRDLCRGHTAKSRRD